MIRSSTALKTVALSAPTPPPGNAPEARASIQRPALRTGHRSAQPSAPVVPLHAPVLTVVLTGGPCGGKTTLLAGNTQAGIPDLPHALAERGIHCTVVTEAAAEEIAATGLPMDGPGGLMGFNLRLTQRQTEKEEAAKQAARATGLARTLVVCDRGPPDNLAYLNPEQTATLRTTLGTKQGLLEPTRYAAVMHLVTAAYGAEAAYRWKESAEGAVDYRPNPPAEARALDDKLRHVYSANPHQHVFDNAAFDPHNPGRSFGAKRQAVVDALVKLVDDQQG